MASGADTAPHDPDPTNKYDTIALQQRAILAKGNPSLINRGHFGITDGGLTYYYGSGTVVVSRSQVEDYVQHGGALGPMLVRLVMAHEYSHVAQAEHYHVVPDANWNKDDVLVTEAQADILGAQFLANELLFDNEGKLDASQLLGAMELMFQLGDHEDTPNHYHPSPDQRRESVRLGLAYGQLLFQASAIRNPELSPEMKGAFANMLSSLAPRLDISGADGEEWSWSLREARKIVHWKATNLPLTTSRSVQVSPDKALFLYSIVYTNHGPSALKLDISVQSISYDAGAAHDSRGAQLYASRRYRLNILPQHSATVQGSLARNRDPGWEPELIAMPDPRAMFSEDGE